MKTGELRRKFFLCMCAVLWYKYFSYGVKHLWAFTTAYFPYSQQIPTEEVTELAGKKIPNIKKINPVFDQFVYPPRSLAETQTPLVSILFLVFLVHSHKMTILYIPFSPEKATANINEHKWNCVCSVLSTSYLLLVKLIFWKLLKSHYEFCWRTVSVLCVILMPSVLLCDFILLLHVSGLHVYVWWPWA